MPKVKASSVVCREITSNLHRRKVSAHHQQPAQHFFKPATLANAIAGIFVSMALTGQSYAQDVSSSCTALGGVIENGVCRFSGLNMPAFNTSLNADRLDLVIEGGTSENQYGIDYVKTDPDAVIELSNRNGRTITIKGGTGKNAHGINYLGNRGGTVNVINEHGEIVIQGSASANGLNKLALDYGYGNQEVLRVDIQNKSKISLLGSSEPSDSYNGYGIRLLSSISYVNCSILNDEGAEIILKGGAENTAGVSSISVVNKFVNKGSITFEGGIGKNSSGVSGIDAMTIDNEGEIVFRGGEGESSYGMNTGATWNDGHFGINNNGLVKIIGGPGINSAGMNHLSGTRGNIEFNNNNQFVIQGGNVEGSVGIQVMADGTDWFMSPNVRINNNKDFKILGGGTPTSYGITEVSNSRGKITFENKAGGVLSILGGSGGAFAINSTYNLTLNNYGTVILDEKAIGTLNGKFRNKETGVVLTPVLAMFEGEVNQTSNDTPKEIFVLHDDKVESMTSPLFVTHDSVGQQGTVTLKEDWKKKARWDKGGTVVFTDVVDGTELASSIKSQFDAAFNSDYFTGTTVKFTGTGSGSGSGSTTFDMNVVHSLIDEGKLSAGSIVTSESLTHSGKAFTLGNHGDMTQDTGFMGIQGVTAITVQDGKTLTLMGKQATMAMSVGADSRDASFVITDAPMTLQNGSLNLGHKRLSATEGRLATVNYDEASHLNVNYGVFSIESLKGDGQLILSKDGRATVEGNYEGGALTNAGTLTVLGKTTLKVPGVSTSGFRAAQEGIFINDKGGTLNFNGGVDVTDFAVLGNREGGTINAGHVRVDPMGVIENLEGGTLNYASLEAYGIIRQNGQMNITGHFTVSDEYETALEGETKVGTLTVGRPTIQCFRRAEHQAYVRNSGKTYADELDLVSGRILVSKEGVLAGKTLRGGVIGSDITVEVGGTFAFSHNKSSLEGALKAYKGVKDNKAILALNTDLHFAKGGSLTVGTVAHDKGTVNLGRDALLLLGTTELHGEALFNGESRQHLHAEDGAVIAMTDDLLWGNHYLMKGFDQASTDDIMKVGVKDKDGHALTTQKNNQGIYVTVGSDNILDKDRDYRLVNQMNWLLDGHQDLTTEAPDVAFLTTALLNSEGALATDRMEALAMDAGVLAETQRMGEDMHDLMLEHASSGRLGNGTFWAEGLFAKTKSGDFKRTSGSSTYDSSTTGFAFGMDLPVSMNDWRLGAAFSTQRGDLDGKFGLSSNIEGYGFSVYGGRTLGSGLSITSALSYLTTSHDVRANNLGSVKADVDVNGWVFGTRLAMPVAYKQVWMTPYVGAEIMKLKEDGFTASWNRQAAFNYDNVNATLFRTPLGVKAGTFMPVAWLGHSGTLNWDADLAFEPQFADKEAEYRVSGVTNGHSDALKGRFANDWLTTVKLGMSWQGAMGSFGFNYGAEMGDVRELSHSVRAQASIYF